ncbi:hypothetical protein A3Q56_06453, partial [Intoshia linei]
MEKHSNMQNTINQLVGSQEKTQSKTFTKWINFRLANSPLYIQNISHDLRDGIILLSLMNGIANANLPIINKKKMTRVHYISNVSVFLEFLDKNK